MDPIDLITDVVAPKCHGLTITHKPGIWILVVAWREDWRHLPSVFESKHGPKDLADQIEILL